MAKRQRRYERGNHNPHIEEEQTTQMDKRKRTNNDRQKYTYKTKDRVTQSPQKTGDELRCSGRGEVPAPLVAPVVFYKTKKPTEKHDTENCKMRNRNTINLVLIV
jgi:hypothetical protein